MPTKRQADVLILVQKGLSNKLIARELHITESTAKVHVGGLLKKFGAKNRTQLALLSLGKRVPVMPVCEQVPCCWVRLSGKKIGAISFMDPKNDKSWDPVYLKVAIVNKGVK